MSATPSKGKKAAKLQTDQPTLPLDDQPKSIRYSGFNEFGFKMTIELLCEEIRELYLEDQVPWIIGYSGGKDSTATLQLIWLALKDLSADQKSKPVHVISTDTLVENPIVSAWVRKSLDQMRVAASAQAVPIRPNLLHPRVDESFWVNLIGRGYPAPRHKFRWCTERLKIRPSNRFISDVVTKNGEAILVLGARKEESQARAKVLKKNEKYRVRSRLSPSATLAGCLIYTPIEDWTSDDVWMFLTQVKNPWGHSNRDLLGMYAGASADGECPLVVDTSTPSCGDSRFGCWVCTLVEKDKSMTAMIQNDSEKEWMLPLLDLRNSLDFRSNATAEDPLNSDHHLRDFRRMTGVINIMQSGKPVPGPYTQQSREEWLRKLLAAQTHIRKHGPADVKNIDLVTLDELQEIRRIWVVDKHELEDTLPSIYKESTGQAYPGAVLDDDLVLGAAEMSQLAEICGGDRLHYELSRELLSLTRQQRNAARRAGLFEKMEKTFSKHFYDDEQDALKRARNISEEREDIRKKRQTQMAILVQEPASPESLNTEER
jgi:DNA sulfur modification protein DndC